MKIDLTGSDGMFTNVVNGPIYYSNVINENQDPNSVIINLIKTGITNMFKFLGLSTLPLLTFLIPLGIYTMISKKKLSEFFILFSIVIVLLIPAFYAYSRNFQEVRYLLPIFPIFCLFSVYFIRYITEKIKYKKLFLILISILVISSTVGFIEYKNSDHANQEEAYQVGKEIIKLTKVITHYSQSGYLDNMRIIEANEFPILRKDLPWSIINIYPDNYETFEEYISNNKDEINRHNLKESHGIVSTNNHFTLDVQVFPERLEYVIVDKGDGRSKFLNDVF